MSEQVRIGEALVARGAIDEQQLAAALAIQENTGDVLLGQVLSEKFSVPVEVVDQVNVQAVLLPRFRKTLMSWLLSFSRGDKFAKGLDIITFVVSVFTVAESSQVDSYIRRSYVATENGCQHTMDEHGVVTRMNVRVTVVTKDGHEVTDNLHAEHDSRTNRLTITDDETRIKETIYYGLRTVYRSSL